MARRPWAVLPLLTWPWGAWALRQVPDDLLRRYKEMHAEAYGLPRTTTPPLSAQRREGQKGRQPEHHWPHSAGNVGEYHLAVHQGPRNFTKSLRWSWHHPDGRYHTTVMGGPLIDADMNIYLSTEDGIRKFGPDGEVLWYYVGRSAMVGCPSLAGAALFGNTQNGYLYALNISDGKELWAKRYSTSVGLDQAFVEVHDSIVVTGVDSVISYGGNSRMIGVDAGSGVLLWQYPLPIPTLDVMPIFPNDGTTLFQDKDGGVCRLGLFNGTKLWHVHPKTGGYSVSRGGLSLGPDGSVYSCANPGHEGEGDLGILRKFRIADGALLWERLLPYACNSWPAVMPERDTVVVPIGGTPNLPTSANYITDKRFVKHLHEDSMLAGSQERSIMGFPELRGAILGISTRTGAIMWRYEVKPWGAMGAAGDEEGVVDRHKLKLRPVCMPSHWAAPAIDIDGTVLVGRLDGIIYSVSTISGLVKQYKTGSGAPPGGVAFAPGIMAYADCDSLYVFNTPKASATQLEARRILIRRRMAAASSARRAPAASSAADSHWS